MQDLLTRLVNENSPLIKKIPVTCDKITDKKNNKNLEEIISRIRQKF